MAVRPALLLLVCSACTSLLCSARATQTAAAAFHQVTGPQHARQATAAVPPFSHVSKASVPQPSVGATDAEFKWYLELTNISVNQVNGTLLIFVYLRNSSSSSSSACILPVTIPAAVAHPLLCSFFSSFVPGNTSLPPTAFAAPIDLNQCMQRTGIPTRMPPKDDASPAEGPQHAAIRLEDLVITASNNGKDVTSTVNAGAPRIMWGISGRVPGSPNTRLFTGIAQQSSSSRSMMSHQGAAVKVGAAAGVTSAHSKPHNQPSRAGSKAGVVSERGGTPPAAG